MKPSTSAETISTVSGNLIMSMHDRADYIAIIKCLTLNIITYVADSPDEYVNILENLRYILAFADVRRDAKMMASGCFVVKLLVR